VIEHKVNVVTTYLKHGCFLHFTQRTLPICILSTPAHHPKHIGNQEPRPSKLHFCGKYNQQSKFHLHWSGNHSHHTTPTSRAAIEYVVLSKCDPPGQVVVNPQYTL